VKQETHKLRLFTFYVCFANEHTKHIQIITWLQLNYPSFPKWSTVYIRQLKTT